MAVARDDAGDARTNGRRSRGRVRRPQQRTAPPRSGIRATRYGDLVLVATDDPAVRTALCDKLDDQGYRTVVADSSAPIARLAAGILPVVIVLDLDHSDGRGLAVLAEIRQRCAIPVVALSARTGEGAKVVALAAGADDYVAKPFSGGDLLARVRLARRYGKDRQLDREAHEVGSIQIDAGRCVVTVADRSVQLTAVELRLLALLARFRGAAVPRAQLAGEIRAAGANRASQLREHIAALRRKIEEDPRKPRWLVTVVGIGYRLCA